MIRANLLTSIYHASREKSFRKQSSGETEITSEIRKTKQNSKLFAIEEECPYPWLEYDAASSDRNRPENKPRLRRKRTTTDFSIECILWGKNKHDDDDDDDGNEQHVEEVDEEELESGGELVNSSNYEWLNCTRYRPPKLQRTRRKDCTQKRRLGRNPRIPFSSEQVSILEDKFKRSPYLSNTEVIEISKSLLLSESRIKIWFQNRRARERRENQDVPNRRFRLVKSFLEKTRLINPNSRQETNEITDSAFKPCIDQCQN